MKLLYPLLGILAVNAAPVSAKKIEAVKDVGPPPAEPLAAAKALMASVLRDPNSAEYRFMGLHPAHCKAGWASGGNDWFGYAATIEVNSKNAFGGYVGYKPYTILFAENQAWKAIEGAEFGEYGPAKGLLGLGGGAGVCKYLY